MNTKSTKQPLETLTGGIDQFSSNIFKEISSSSSENLICSPLSVNVVLATLSYGAKDKTLQEIRCALHIHETSDDVIQAGYKNVIELLNNVKDVEMNIANNIFTSAKVPIKQSFLDLTLKTFYSTPKQVDFSQAVAAANTINKWCEDQTNGRIKELFKSDVFSAGTGLVLVNAIYFKGEWKEPFFPELTVDLPFYTDETNFENVSMMQKNGELSFGSSDELKADFINIPYQGDDCIMIIILPHEFEGLAHVQENLHRVNISNLVENPNYVRGAKLPDLEGGYTRDEVYLQLPKFKVESEIDLKSILQNLGMKDMFENTANFSGLNDAEMKVDKVLQKAFIEVNEEGSKAAAVTVVSGMRGTDRLCSFSPPTPFFVNRPFCYAIVHRPSKTNLLMGTVKMPNYPKEN